MCNTFGAHEEKLMSGSGERGENCAGIVEQIALVENLSTAIQIHSGSEAAIENAKMYFLVTKSVVYRCVRAYTMCMH